MIIKDAKIIDSIDLFEWRNDQLSCCMSKNNKKLTIKEHEIWFQGSLKNPLRKLSPKGHEIFSLIYRQKIEK